MYLHIIAPEIQIEAEELLQDYMKYRRTTDVGNGIISGLVLSNSELGCGSFECSARAVIMRCTNGLTDRNAAIRRVHLGSKLEEGIIEWSDDTKNKNFQLIMSQTQDAIKTFLSKDYLGNLVKKLEGHKKTLLEHPEGVIEKVGQVMNISESHKINVLRHFLQDNDNSCFGMMNAFIREAQNMQADMQFTTEQTAFSMMGQYKSFDKPSKN